MYIQEAVKKTVEEKLFITRKNKEIFRDIKIKPTNTSRACEVYRNNSLSVPRWNPQAEDLMADDWIVSN